MAEYFTLVESKGLPVNVVQTIGHTQVRQIVISASSHLSVPLRKRAPRRQTTCWHMIAGESASALQPT